MFVAWLSCERHSINIFYSSVQWRLDAETCGDHTPSWGHTHLLRDPGVTGRDLKKATKEPAADPWALDKV